MAIEAFKSRRVRESLKALESYLGQAAHLADGVKPSETIKLELEPAREAASPRVTKVVWKHSKPANAGVIAEADLKASPVLTVTVSGKHLVRQDDHGGLVLDISSFKLIGPDGAGAYFEAVKLTATSVDEFEADLTLVHGKTAQLGSYEARAFHVDGQTAVQPDACSIEADKPALAPGPALLGPGPALAPPAPAPVARAKRSSVQLGTMNPNRFAAGARGAQTELVVLSGSPTEFWVANLAGDRLSDAVIDRTDQIADFTVFHLLFDVPKPASDKDRFFYLVADKNGDAKLAFFVQYEALK
jgi:hypothetical protein